MVGIESESESNFHYGGVFGLFCDDFTKLKQWLFKTTL